jgi:hypothetical protein
MVCLQGTYAFWNPSQPNGWGTLQGAFSSNYILFYPELYHQIDLLLQAQEFDLPEQLGFTGSGELVELADIGLTACRSRTPSPV